METNKSGAQSAVRDNDETDEASSSSSNEMPVSASPSPRLSLPPPPLRSGRAAVDLAPDHKDVDR